jgi:hypothetical protein
MSTNAYPRFHNPNSFIQDCVTFSRKERPIAWNEISKFSSIIPHETMFMLLTYLHKLLDASFLLCIILRARISMPFHVLHSNLNLPI